MYLEKKSPCKVNLLLNVLGKRPDGFHELETILHPVNVFDELVMERGGRGIVLSCSESSLPTDEKNLVHRAASAFLKTAGTGEGVKIRLEKKIPLAAGLGGGSGNAATTLLGLNELFGKPLSGKKLNELAGAIGSDVSFFLQDRPALATGRGEKIQSLEFFPALRGKAILLLHPGFGISTPWAYQNLARFPEALNGRPGRAAELISRLRTNDWPSVANGFHNSLEAPALDKFPILALYQEFLRANGALAALMSGSGSTTFAVVADVIRGEVLLEKFNGKFGEQGWSAVVAIP